MSAFHPPLPQLAHQVASSQSHDSTRREQTAGRTRDQLSEYGELQGRKRRRGERCRVCGDVERGGLVSQQEVYDEDMEFEDTYAYEDEDEGGGGMFGGDLVSNLSCIHTRP